MIEIKQFHNFYFLVIMARLSLRHKAIIRTAKMNGNRRMPKIEKCERKNVTREMELYHRAAYLSSDKSNRRQWKCTKWDELAQKHMERTASEIDGNEQRRIFNVRKHFYSAVVVIEKNE